jgi:hypothetical protein
VPEEGAEKVKKRFKEPKEAESNPPARHERPAQRAAWLEFPPAPAPATLGMPSALI